MGRFSGRFKPIVLKVSVAAAVAAIITIGLWSANTLAPEEASAQFSGFSDTGEVLHELMPTGVDSNRNLLPPDSNDPHWMIERTYNDSGIGRPTCQLTDGARTATVIEEVGGRAGLSYEGARPWAFTSPNARWIGQNRYGRSEGHGLGNPHPSGGSWCYDPGYIGSVPPSAPGDPPTQKGPPGEYPMFDNPPHADWNTFVFRYTPDISIDSAVDFSSLQLEVKGSVDDLVGVTVNGIPLDVECEGSPATTVTEGNVPMCATGLEGNQFKATVMEGTAPFHTDGSSNVLRIYVKSAFSNTGMIITSARIIGTHANAELTVNTEGLPAGTPAEFDADPHQVGDCVGSGTREFTVTDSRVCTSSGGLGIGWHDHGGGAIGGTLVRAPGEIMVDGVKYVFSSWSGGTWADGGEHCAGEAPNEKCVNMEPQDPTNTGSITAHYELGDEGIRSITGRKVDSDFNMPGPWSDNMVTITGTGVFQQDDGNPFNFYSLPPTSYNVSVEDEPGHTVSWAYCQILDDGVPNSPKKDGSCSLSGTSTKGNGNSFTATPDPYGLSVRFIFTPEEVEAEQVEHKVYGANVIEMAKQFVRDNERFNIDALTYIWPDAGIRGRNGTPPSGDGRSNLWLAGIWGVDAPVPGNNGDNATGDDSWRSNPNVWTSFNTVAEEGCIGNFASCLQRVPAAYVPADDGSGKPNTAQKDGSRTPNGNRWHEIKERRQGGQSNGQVSLCGNYTTAYNPHCGGIASNLNMNVGGRTGNYINNIEMSNIHIQAAGIQAWLFNDAGFLQGHINDNLLQVDDRSRNLPTGSQGPQDNKWDNIREPNTGLLTGGVTRSSLSFSNSTRYNGLSNFTYDPQNISLNYKSGDKVFAKLSAVSLLQDGNDTANPPYTKPKEPLTYTATIHRLAQVRLRWNEYTEWTQVDNKGHWYTRRWIRATGVDRGPRSGNFNTTVNRIRRTDYGSRRNYWRCFTRDPWGGSNHYHSNQPTSYSPYNHHSSSDWYCYVYYSTSPQRYCVSQTRVAYNWMTRYYYRHRVETKYGWLNNSRGRNPRNTNWTRTRSSFYSSTNWREANATPPWALTGNDHYWQDMAVTGMSNSGSSEKPPHADRWIYNTTDPTYNRRHVFNNRTSHSFRSGWYKTGTQCIYRYPNGSHETYTTNAYVGYYHPSSSLLYENSRSASPYYVGRYNFEEDGSSDGIVDYDWDWNDNYQRVRYEQTYNNHHRKLGMRSRSGTPEDDDILYGTDPERHILAGRGASDIYNPVIDVASGDVFAGGNLHSFFQTSRANGQSVFLFSNNGIINFPAGARKYPGYHINQNRGRVDAYYPTDEDPVDFIFRDINEMEGRAANTFPADGNLERGGPQKSDNIWHVGGNLTLNNPIDFRGVGTVIVGGNLHIKGNLDYADISTNSRRDLDSLGVIVRGHIIIDPGVTNIVGSYFSSGVVHTGSVLMDDVRPNGDTVIWDNNNNRVLSDNPLNVNGLMIANNFVLARNPSGVTLEANPAAETFTYDGRVVVNPPPGFFRVFNADAIWNDTVPRN